MAPHAGRDGDGPGGLGGGIGGAAGVRAEYGGRQRVSRRGGAGGGAGGCSVVFDRSRVRDAAAELLGAVAGRGRTGRVVEERSGANRAGRRVAGAGRSVRGALELVSATDRHSRIHAHIADPVHRAREGDGDPGGYDPAIASRVVLAADRLDFDPAQRQAALNNALSCPDNNGFGGINFANVGFGSLNQYTLGLNFSQTLFNGQVLAQSQAVKSPRRAAEIEVTAQRAQVTFDVTQAYYDAALADRLVTIAESTFAQSDRTLKQTQLTKRVGTQSEFDLLQAQVTRNNQVPVVIQRRGDRDIAYFRLKQLVKLPLDAPLQLTTDVEDSTAAPDGVRLASLQTVLDSEGVVMAAETIKLNADTGADRRSTVREQAETVKENSALLRAATSERLPAVVLTSQYQRVAYPLNLPSWADFLTNWNVGVGLSVPIFTGRRIQGDRMVAQANLDEARTRLQQTRELAVLDSRTAIETLREAQAAWAASVGTVTQATRAYQIAELRYKEGILDPDRTDGSANRAAAGAREPRAGRAQPAGRARPPRAHRRSAVVERGCRGERIAECRTGQTRPWPRRAPRSRRPPAHRAVRPFPGLRQRPPRRRPRRIRPRARPEVPRRDRARDGRRNCARIRAVAGVLGVLAAAACGHQAAPADTAILLGPENVAVVTTAQLRTGPVISGTLAPVRDAQIRAQVGGSVLEIIGRSGTARREPARARADRRRRRCATPCLGAVGGERRADRGGLCGPPGPALRHACRRRARSRTVTARPWSNPTCRRRPRWPTPRRGSSAAASSSRTPLCGRRSPAWWRSASVSAGDVVQPGAMLFTSSIRRRCSCRPPSRPTRSRRVQRRASRDVHAQRLRRPHVRRYGRPVSIPIADPEHATGAGLRHDSQPQQRARRGSLRERPHRDRQRPRLRSPRSRRSTPGTCAPPSSACGGGGSNTVDVTSACATTLAEPRPDHRRA